ncbi:MAG: glutamate--cysteine ligase [Actinomycetota bacterium]|nr:glutamate--cysteine ligase [Actinomycetota bacterium]
MPITFTPSERTSLGIEMELEVVHQDTRELHPAASEILAALGAGCPGGAHPRAKHELFESTVEIITGICTRVADARGDLAATLDQVRAETDRRGLELLCSGTHPFSQWADQTISPDRRYHQLVDEMQWTARRLQIFGIHVHVGVRSGEKAIAIANGLAPYIPHFLGVSSSSPYWMGHDTGLASARSKVFEALPTAGLPYELSDWADFERFMTTLVNAKAITSIREVWWDIRPHPNFGTVELRMCDGLPTLREVAAVAAMAQCLVEWMNAVLDRDGALPTSPGWVLRHNKWRAARHGVDAEIIVDDDGHLVRLADAVAHLVDELHPVAERLGCTDELGHALAMLKRPSYARQREVVARGGSLVDVVDSLVAELREDRPWEPAPARAPGAGTGAGSGRPR